MFSASSLSVVASYSGVGTAGDADNRWPTGHAVVIVIELPSAPLCRRRALITASHMAVHSATFKNVYWTDKDLIASC